MQGLWLASNDLRNAVVMLRRSRRTLHAATSANARAAENLEHTIHELKDLRALPQAMPLKVDKRSESD